MREIVLVMQTFVSFEELGRRVRGEDQAVRGILLDQHERRALRGALGQSGMSLRPVVGSVRVSQI